MDTGIILSVWSKLAPMGMKTRICANQRKSAVKYPLKNFYQAIVPNGDIFCLSSSLDKQKSRSLRPQRLCGDSFFFCDNLRKTAVNSF